MATLILVLIATAGLAFVAGLFWAGMARGAEIDHESECKYPAVLTGTGGEYLRDWPSRVGGTVDKVA